MCTPTHTHREREPCHLIVAEVFLRVYISIHAEISEAGVEYDFYWLQDKNVAPYLIPCSPL